MKMSISPQTLLISLLHPKNTKNFLTTGSWRLWQHQRCAFVVKFFRQARGHFCEKNPKKIAIKLKFFIRIVEDLNGVLFLRCRIVRGSL